MQNLSVSINMVISSSFGLLDKDWIHIGQTLLGNPRLGLTWADLGIVRKITRFGPNRPAADMEGNREYVFWMIYEEIWRNY